MAPKLVTKQQLDFVFQPELTAACATMACFHQPPEGFGKLAWSSDRGGTCDFYQYTVSTYGDDDKRVVGVRVWDPVAQLYKEDLRVYDRQTSTVTIYPKGRFERVNKCFYQQTHYTT